MARGAAEEKNSRPLVFASSSEALPAHHHRKRQRSRRAGSRRQENPRFSQAGVVTRSMGRARVRMLRTLLRPAEEVGFRLDFNLGRPGEVAIFAEEFPFEAMHGR